MPVPPSGVKSPLSYACDHIAKIHSGALLNFYRSAKIHSGALLNSYRLLQRCKCYFSSF